MKLLLLTHHTYFCHLERATGNDEFVQKWPGYQFPINVLVLWEFLKSYFNISTSSSVNLYLEKCFIVLSDVNGICVFFVNFLNFFLCDEITLLTTFPTFCLMQILIYIDQVCKIFAWSFPNFFSSPWRLFN